MSSEFSTQAANTVAILQQAHRNGTPVLIPGALERRTSVSATATRTIDVPPAGPAHSATLFDRGRLEHEREGGGAPSQRAGKRRGTIGARLWQSLRHPMQVPEIWRRLLPEAL